jgi:hypothetical protein
MALALAPSWLLLPAYGAGHPHHSADPEMQHAHHAQHARPATLHSGGSGRHSECTLAEREKNFAAFMMNGEMGISSRSLWQL